MVNHKSIERKHSVSGLRENIVTFLPTVAYFFADSLLIGRIYRLCEEQISPTQFGFRNVLGTREALFSIQVLFQRCKHVNCDVYACFIDYQKEYDRLQRQKMVETLKNIGLDEKILELLLTYTGIRLLL